MCIHITYLRMHACMYCFTPLYVGTIIEGPSNVTYIPGLTPLPIELTCNVTGLALWRVNNSVTAYTLSSLESGALPGHSRDESNILINSPVNNTEYICVSSTVGGDDSSNPAFVVVAGEYNTVKYQICTVCIVCTSCRYCTYAL